MWRTKRLYREPDGSPPRRCPKGLVTRDQRLDVLFFRVQDLISTIETCRMSIAAFTRVHARCFLHKAAEPIWTLVDPETYLHGRTCLGKILTFSRVGLNISTSGRFSLHWCHNCFFLNLMHWLTIDFWVLVLVWEREGVQPQLSCKEGLSLVGHFGMFMRINMGWPSLINIGGGLYIRLVIDGGVLVLGRFAH